MVTIEAKTPAAVGGSMQENVGLDSHGAMMPVLGLGTALPCEATQVFSTGTDDQDALAIPLFRGVRAMTQDNTPLGTLFIQGIPPKPAGIPQIAVTLAIKDGDLVAFAADDRGEFEVEVELLPPEED